MRYGPNALSVEKYVSEHMNIFRIMPIVPRYKFSNTKTGESAIPQALDSTTMFIMDNIDDITSSLDREELVKFEDLDQQVLNMVNDGQNILRENGYLIKDRVFMTGFSAAGVFTARFTSLYPEKIDAMLSMGMHIQMIPTEEYKEYKLIYGIGVKDNEYLTGHEFDIDVYNSVAKLMYLGGMDENDPVPYNDSYTDEQREIIISLLGDNYLDRWNNLQDIFFEVGGDGMFITSRTKAHVHNEEMKIVALEFFQMNAESDEPWYFEYFESDDLMFNDGDDEKFTRDDLS